jgi:hypothetical protein
MQEVKKISGCFKEYSGIDLNKYLFLDAIFLVK